MASVFFNQEEEDEEKLLNQALHVDFNGQDHEDLDESGLPPATGEEYLRKVVREAKKLDFVTTGIILPVQ